MINLETEFITNASLVLVPAEACAVAINSVSLIFY